MESFFIENPASCGAEELRLKDLLYIHDSRLFECLLMHFLAKMTCIVDAFMDATEMSEQSKQSFASFVLGLRNNLQLKHVFATGVCSLSVWISCIAMAQFDVILFGATGFTGSLMLKYLAQKTGVRYALCGRNKSKLEQAIAETCRRSWAVTTEHVCPSDASLANPFLDPITRLLVSPQGCLFDSTVY